MLPAGLNRRARLLKYALRVGTEVELGLKAGVEFPMQGRTACAPEGWVYAVLPYVKPHKGGRHSALLVALSVPKGSLPLRCSQRGLHPERGVLSRAVA